MLLYSAAIQPDGRAVIDTRASSIVPSNFLSAPSRSAIITETEESAMVSPARLACVSSEPST